MSLPFEHKDTAIYHAKRDSFINTLGRFFVYEKNFQWFYAVSMDRIKQEKGVLYETWVKSASKEFYLSQWHNDYSKWCMLKEMHNKEMNV